MYSIQDELALEEQMMLVGKERFEARNKKAEEAGRGDETSYAKRLLPAYFKVMVEEIAAFVNGKGAKRYGKYRALMRGIDAEQIALFTMREIFAGLMKQRLLSAVAMSIGRAIEDEQRFADFKAKNQDKYDVVMAELEKTRTKSYSHRHAVLTLNANNADQEWEAWSTAERAHVGMACINIACNTCDLIELVTVYINFKKNVVIRATEKCAEWVRNHCEVASMLHPAFAPTVIEPARWTDYTVGGYYSPAVRSRLPFVKCLSKEHVACMRNAKLTGVYNAATLIQNTPWEINTAVHDVLKEVWKKNLRIGMPPSEPYVVPPSPVARDKKRADMSAQELEDFRNWCMQASAIYTLEKERISNCYYVVQVLRMAEEYRQYGILYFPIHADFRSRLYAACPGLSPQGGDFSKGLLRFHKGKPLGKTGVRWFLLHGAGKYGYDKMSFDDRIKAILEREREILDTAEDPMSNTDFWGNADKPWQFLAWCFEYAGYKRDGEAFVSHLPISLDGSCNGLQHYSAMLRDSVGGAATNLIPADTPQDIYQAVADVCIKKLQAMDDPMARKWLEFGITRKLAKKPVMTLPYGSTKRTCTSSILACILEQDRTFFGNRPFMAALFLSNILWDSIGDVVIAARAGMDWLKKAATTIAKTNKAIIWHTPMDFPVYQKSCQFDTIVVKQTIYNKMYQINFGRMNEVIDKNKMRNGIAPNFVHSMDASHMMLTITAAAAEGIDCFACIHDDYGTHAADTERFFQIIREQFVKMYTEHDPLAEFKQEQEEALGIKLPDLPARGDLDIRRVVESDYFFA